MDCLDGIYCHFGHDDKLGQLFVKAAIGDATAEQVKKALEKRDGVPYTYCNPSQANYRLGDVGFCPVVNVQDVKSLIQSAKQFVEDAKSFLSLINPTSE